LQGSGGYYSPSTTKKKEAMKVMVLSSPEVSGGHLPQDLSQTEAPPTVVAEVDGMANEVEVGVPEQVVEPVYV